MAMQQDQPIEVLEAELDRLRNSCQHLQRSNHELQQALNLDGPDPEFEEAIEENIVVVARQQAKIARIEQEIQEAQAAQPLETVLASAQAQESTKQVAHTAENALQQQHLPSGVKSHIPPAAAHASVQPEHSLQPQQTADDPHLDVQMTDAQHSTGYQTASPSMWL